MLNRVNKSAGFIKKRLIAPFGTSREIRALYMRLCPRRSYGKMSGGLTRTIWSIPASLVLLELSATLAPGFKAAGNGTTSSRTPSRRWNGGAQLRGRLDQQGMVGFIRPGRTRIYEVARAPSALGVARLATVHQLRGPAALCPRTEDWPQRSMPVRQRQEIQKVLWEELKYWDS